MIISNHLNSHHQIRMMKITITITLNITAVLVINVIIKFKDSKNQEIHCQGPKYKNVSWI